MRSIEMTSKIGRVVPLGTILCQTLLLVDFNVLLASLSKLSSNCSFGCGGASVPAFNPAKLS